MSKSIPTLLPAGGIQRVLLCILLGMLTITLGTPVAHGEKPTREEVVAYVGECTSARRKMDLIERLGTDFAGLDLSGVCFRGGYQAAGTNLRGADIRGAKLTDADFDFSHLDGADFTAANLTDARFYHASMRNATLKDAKVAGTRFYASHLSEAKMVVSIFRRVRSVLRIFVARIFPALLWRAPIRKVTPRWTFKTLMLLLTTVIASFVGVAVLSPTGAYSYAMIGAFYLMIAEVVRGRVSRRLSVGLLAAALVYVLLNWAVYFAVGAIDAFAFFDPPFMIGVVFAGPLLAIGCAIAAAIIAGRGKLRILAPSLVGFVIWMVGVGCANVWLIGEIAGSV
jgi:uncharacterized protein YjbI with pentapeptide repeats